MRSVVTVYCNLSNWAEDQEDCFDFVSDYEAVPPGSIVVALLTKEDELLVPPDDETMTDEQMDYFHRTVEIARRALSQ